VTEPAGTARRLLRRVADVREDEFRAVLWSGAYFFCLLAGYYILRPIRDEMGVAGGVRNLPWLYTGTLVTMLVLNPAFAALVARLPRLRFVSLTYRFFMLNLLAFFVLLRALPPESTLWVGRAFFVWVSVFNMFVVSIFWAFMADLFRTAQGKRLFGFIGLGGTLGGVIGAGITAVLAERVGPVQLLLVSVVLLECAVFCVRRLSACAGDLRCGTPAEENGPPAERPIGGSVLAGITHVARSPYLLGICAYMLLYTVNSTVLYFQQAEIVSQSFTDRAARTAVFARIDLAVNLLTILTQAFLTGRIIRWIGVGATLALLPALCMAGFAGLGFWPVLGLLVVFQVSRRAGNYAVARPARETLYTVVPREDKFKAKSFIDTFVYRAGDQIGAWSYAFLGWLGLAMTSIAFLTVPVAGLWLLIGLWLGRKQAELSRTGILRGQ
jgi:AAA family ATP:ADP antiporter